MKRRRGLTSLVLFIGIALALLALTFWQGNTPLLGLDLQGGVSVVLEPTGDVNEQTLDDAIEIIEKRVNSLGIAEPEIRRQGDTIVVEIPGVKDRERALELVGKTAELQFRPVLAVVPAAGQLVPEDGTTDPSVPTEPSVPTDSSVVPDSTVSTETTVAPADGGDETGLGASGEFAFGRQDPQVTTDATDLPAGGDSAPVGTEGGAVVGQGGTVVGEDGTIITSDGTTIAGDGTATTALSPTSLPPDICETGVPPEQDQPDQTVILPLCQDGVLVEIYQLGPALLSGDTLETARKNLSPQGQWVVNPVFREGASGIDQFNAAAAQCNSGAPTCPTGRLAIVLDGEVVSAPTIQEPSFGREEIQISGSFTERTAGELATVLRYGALPVELVPQQVQIVSASIGQDALDAGLWSALVGLVLVTVYMVAYYRLLGVLAMVKLGFEAALLWAIISWLGENNGLALTLAGVTGLIVSIGVSVDSNVVYYEHLREDIRNGRTVRSATDKSFVSAWSTIVKADVSSLIAAGLLWWLTIGPVRGFAFYLGLSTVLDLIASYFYMRPAVGMATRSELCQRHPRWFGLPAAAASGPDQPAAEPVKAGVGS